MILYKLIKLNEKFQPNRCKFARWYVMGTLISLNQCPAAADRHTSRGARMQWNDMVVQHAPRWRPTHRELRKRMNSKKTMSWSCRKRMNLKKTMSWRQLVAASLLRSRAARGRPPHYRPHPARLYRQVQKRQPHLLQGHRQPQDWDQSNLVGARDALPLEHTNKPLSRCFCLHHPSSGAAEI